MMSNRIKYASCTERACNPNASHGPEDSTSCHANARAGQSSLLLRQELAVLLHGQQSLLQRMD